MLLAYLTWATVCRHFLDCQMLRWETIAAAMRRLRLGLWNLLVVLVLVQ
jgi:hypothetical protein